MRQLILCLFIILSLPALLYAQSPEEGTVKGIVVEGDKNRNPILGQRVPNALVSAIAYIDIQKHQANPSADLPQRRSKDPGGEFAFPALSVGQWRFFVYKEGYDYYESVTPTQVCVRHTTDTIPEYLPLRKAPAADKRRAPAHESHPIQSDQVSLRGIGLVLVMQKREIDPVPTQDDYYVDVQVNDFLGRPVPGAFISVLELQGNRLVDILHGEAPKGHFRGRPSTLPHERQYVMTVTRYDFSPTVLVRGWVSGPVTVVLAKALEASETAGIEINEGSHRKPLTGETGRTLETLPLPGMRSFDLLSLLSSGVLPPPETIGKVGPSFAPGLGTAGSFVANGLRSRENSFGVDGGDDNDELVGTRRQGFVIPSSQSVETIQEFETISALPDARFGRAIGGQVNIVSKPSVGGLHGSIYGFFTNRALSARDAFEGTTLKLPAQYPVTTSSGVPVFLDGQPAQVENPSMSLAPFSRAQAGATVGFNIRNTYVYMAGERLVQAGREETHFAVPSIEERGAFGSGSTGMSINGVPSVPSSVVGDAIFSLYPFPNDPLGPYGRNTYTAQLPNDGNGIRTLLRVDNRIRDFDGWIRFRGNYSREKSVLGSTGGAIDSSIMPTIQNYGFSEIISGATLNQAHTFRISGAGTVASLNPQAPNVLAPSANLLLNLTRLGAPQVNYVSAASQTGQQTLSSMGLGGVVQTTPITGPVGQVVIDGFSPVGADAFSYPQKRNNITGQLSYAGVVTKHRNVYSFGAEWQPTRLDTTSGANARPLVEFAGLHNSGTGSIVVTAPSGVADTNNFSGTTMAALGVPIGVLQTFADVRPPLTGRIPIKSAFLNQGVFFFQTERQLNTRARIVAGLRVGLSDAHDTGPPTLESTFNRQQLLADAQEAEALCGSRCAGLSDSVAQAFPKDFKRFTPGNRLGLDPRFGFAWLPVPGRTWSIRGGFGIYSGRLQFFAANDARQGFNAVFPINYANFPVASSAGAFLFNLANPLVRQLSPGLDVIKPGFANALTGNPFVLLTQGLFDLPGLGLQPTLPSLPLIRPAANLRNPYSLQYSIGTEAEIRGFAFSLSYVGTRGENLLRLVSPEGGVNRGSVRFDGASISTFGFPNFQGQLLPPGNQILLGGSLTIAQTQYASSASSLYNSVQLEVRKRYSHGLQFSSALTYSRSFDDASDALDLVGVFPLPQNSQAISEWGPSSFDVPIRFSSSFVWDIAPRQRTVLLKDWQAAGIVSVQSGQPFTVNSTFDVNEDGNLTDRLNTTAGLSGSTGVRTVIGLSPGTSTQALLAANGQNGAIGRNTFRNLPSSNIDIALSKAFELGESRRVTIRCEGFNVLNSPHFGIPQRLLEAPSFGQEVRTVASPRMLQLALRFSF